MVKKLSRQLVEHIYYKNLNVVEVGEFKIKSTTESLDKILISIENLIKSYNHFNNLYIKNKIEKGQSGGVY